jgi:dihydroxy-acid dehydratase
MAENRKINSDLPFGLEYVNAKQLMLGLGYTREELKKPRIGVINTYSDFNPGHIHQRDLALAATEGIYEAGGLACNFNTLSFCDSLQPKGAYALASRDLICNSVEVLARAQHLDAMVLIATCDKNVPAILMAAARVNIPSIIVTGGHMKSNIYHGKQVDFIDINITASAVEEGRCSQEYLDGLVDVACPGVGACNMMGTACSMQIVSEALGMSLPGNATCSAVDKSTVRMAREAGRQIMELWKKNICPRDIITEKSMNNAVRMLMACGGSTNTMYHVPAIASEAGLTCAVWDIFDAASHEVPLLMAVRPVGVHSMTDFARAGGVRAMFTNIKHTIHLDCLTVNGKTVGENIEGHEVQDREVIRFFDDPYRIDGGICILKGNIAPEGCAAKQSTFPDDMLKFRGPVKVFFDPNDAIDALHGGKIQAGDCIVILNQGAKGGPCMESVYNFTSALAGSTLAGKCAMITDGRFSGAAKGAIIGYASPESALRGPICALRDGDIIRYDIETRSIEAELTDEQIAQRVEAFDKEIKWHTGYLGLYQSWVGSVAKGAVHSGKN